MQTSEETQQNISEFTLIKCYRAKGEGNYAQGMETYLLTRDCPTRLNGLRQLLLWVDVAWDATEATILGSGCYAALRLYSTKVDSARGAFVRGSGYTWICHVCMA